MEALSFIKFWRPTTTTSTSDKENQTLSSSGNGDAIEGSNVVVGSDCELVDEGDDSFFELELTLSDFDNKRNNCNSDNTHQGNSEEQVHYSTKTAGHNGELKISSSSDVLSKRKILPIEPTSTSKPQSPIALLKSAPKLRVSIFKKSKSMAATLRTEKTDSTTTSSKQEKRENNKLFTVKFKVEEISNLSMFTRACSLRRTSNTTNDSASSSSSKRFSKDLIQKYLKLIKPLYVKVSKTKNEKMRFSGQLTEASPTSSPATLPVHSPLKERNTSGGFRALNRHLGKSKSASATVSSPARRDDSLLLQHDGIQSAILHCKKSFNSSRDSSSFSRSTSSSSSQGTLSYLSSKDASLFPRFSSDSSYEEIISARRSNDERI
ncbi:hypothetical protein Pint_17572 [Pistacia integerrima]|uniref:Uncharacterized protein n=1 Tax=Pistacia integerrima TaxID=434235 RepID=A0ACC0YZY9_9ROSI|nr:hypothetical protein Pint_17572 [Pistacia integerrima]